MASAPDLRTAGGLSNVTRPRMPRRTLSSSLRLYSSPLVPRADFRSRTLPPNGGLSPTHEVNETDPLLGFSPHHKTLSNASAPTGSIGTEPEDWEDLIDVEADPSDEQADSDGLYPPNCCWTADANNPPKRSDPFGNKECDVYGNIHRVRHEIISNIDDPYSLEQLKAPRMNISVVRPLVEKFYTMQDLSIIYCLLVNRAQFIREQSYAAHHQTVNLTRALLCELLAEKVLRRYNEFNPGPRGLLKLANILVAGFEPFQGASEAVIKESTQATYSAQKQKAGRHHHKLTALEVAIVSESKSFLASTACQKVVDAIYRGKVVYSPSSYIDIIPDRWKRRPISLYDPRRAPVLNQYRLVVPRTRNWIEVIQFIILLMLYIAVMTGRETRNTTKYEVIETIFEIFAFGWILDQLASTLEHGWSVYTQNLWSFLDIMFSTLFLIYFGLRMRGLYVSDPAESDAWAIASLDVLSCAAPVLIPRLAFNIMSENMLFLSLRAMMGDFVTLTALAFWCFAGFLLSLKWLHNGLHESLTISKWMIFVWFGLDGTGIDQAATFHPYLGPILMVTFAFLGNTLFLTILVSMLTNTFSSISANAVQEIQFRRAVLTFLGVKSDSLFAFQPPFNLAALFILAPLKSVLTPRMFHTVNVFMVRVVNFPALILISWYERNTLWVSNQYRHIQPKRIDWRHTGGPRVIAADWWSSTIKLWDFSKFSVHGDIQAVFDSEPPEYVLNDDHENDDQDDLEEFNDLGPLSPKLGNHLRNRMQAQFKMPFTKSPTASSSADNTRPGTPTLLAKDKDKEVSKSPLSASQHLSRHLSRSQPSSAYASTSQSPAITRRSSKTNTTTVPTTPNDPLSRSQLSTISQSQTKSKSHTHKRKRHQSTAAGVTSPTTGTGTNPSSDAALRKEFHDSEDEQENLARRKSRAFPSSKKPKRIERKDSLIDYEDTNFGAIEANARLLGLERRLARMEEMLSRIVAAAEDAVGGGLDDQQDENPDAEGGDAPAQPVNVRSTANANANARVALGRAVSAAGIEEDVGDTFQQQQTQTQPTTQIREAGGSTARDLITTIINPTSNRNNRNRAAYTNTNRFLNEQAIDSISQESAAAEEDDSASSGSGSTSSSQSEAEVETAVRNDFQREMR